MKNLIILLLVMSLQCMASGQDTGRTQRKNFAAVSVSFEKGNIIPTTGFVRGDNLLGKQLKNFTSISIKTVWQNPGYREWQRIYRGPYYGAGISISYFEDSKEVGNPVSVFGILGIPVKRWNRLEIYPEFQFGIACNWVKYDSITNPKNLVIGGGLTVHLNIGIQAFYAVNKNLDLGAGLGFIHFSNGGMERPNRGFNIYSPSFELKYHIPERPPTRTIRKPGILTRHNELYLMLGYGNHQLVEHELDTNYFAVAGLSAICFRQISNAFRIGIGTDFNYWMGLTANPDGTMGKRNFENLTNGIILQPEMIVGRLSLTGGIGLYTIHRNYGNCRQLYQRLGIRYDVYRNLSLGVNVRAVNFMLAEFLEFNLGYVFRENQNQVNDHR